MIYLYRACFAFCGGHFAFLIRGLPGRGLEPKLKKTVTGGKILRLSEYMRWLHCYTQ